jgi:crotonobetainyl-CoA:carnitine CoA-transferase CaiB-like acyl-CoA transferase
MTMALSGIRVIDMTSILMGPYATQLLGDFGADIIKIEPLNGDNTRWIGPARHPGMSGGFLGTNASKRSVAINLKTEAGKQILLRMATHADVLIYNVRPQAMARLGLTYEVLSALNSRLLYVGVFGYGRGGRYAAKPAYDDLIQALTGLPWLYGQATGSEPRYVPAPIVDRVVGVYAAMTILAGLQARDRIGVGQQIDVPMFETFAQMIMGSHLQGHAFVPPIGPIGYSRMLSPSRKPYRTSDGYVAILPYTDENWRRLFEVAGQLERYEADPRFRDITLRTQNIDALYEILEEIVAERTTAEWLALLEKADVPSMPVHSLESLLHDPHLADVGFFKIHEHPTEQRLRGMSAPSKWSVTQPGPTRPAPALGEHTCSVMDEMGYTPHEIETLVKQGVLGSPASPVRKAV